MNLEEELHRLKQNLQKLHQITRDSPNSIRSEDLSKLLMSVHLAFDIYNIQQDEIVNFQNMIKEEAQMSTAVQTLPTNTSTPTSDDQIPQIFVTPSLPKQQPHRATPNSPNVMNSPIRGVRKRSPSCDNFPSTENEKKKRPSTKFCQKSPHSGVAKQSSASFSSAHATEQRGLVPGNPKNSLGNTIRGRVRKTQSFDHTSTELPNYSLNSLLMPPPQPRKPTFTSQASKSKSSFRAPATLKTSNNTS